MVRLEQIGDLADDFVRVRLVRITGVDLRLFDFDYDLTWAAFFLSADERVYGRYGGRDASGPDGRMSLAGLRHAMRAALAAHRRGGPAPPPRAGKPVLAEGYPGPRGSRGGECIHCHQVYERRRAALQAEGRWDRNEVWAYPLPENVGLTLGVDEGDRVLAVAPGSAADRAGLRPGDRLRAVNGIPVASQADVQYGLHRAPRKGTVPVRWLRDGNEEAATLELAEGWRKTNITWRPSLLDLLPSLPLYGEDLTAAEKRALGLGEKRLAFRQQRPVPTEAKAAGLRDGDVIVGINGEVLDATVEQFLGHVRRNYLAGDRVTINALRDGKRLDVPLTLR